MTESMKNLKLLAFDVDGTLTHGRIHLGEDGELLKVFNARDGLAMHMAQRVGIKVGLITGRESMITQRRADELGLDFCVNGVINKVAALQNILDTYGFDWSEAGFMGDDLNDLGVLARVGVSASPADAVKEVKNTVDIIVTARGGKGAAREWIENILTARDEWQGMIEFFTSMTED